MKYIVREERPEDWLAAEAMTRRAFWNLHVPGCDEHYLVHKLRSDGVYVPELTRVAEQDGRVVGAIYYARAKVSCPDGSEREVLTFGPLCVEPECQNTGIGKSLLEETLPLAREMGFAGVVIFGEPGYYPKRGFSTCDRFGITDAEGRNFDAFMGIELRAGGLDIPGGRFAEPAVYCNLPADEVERYDQQFPRMEKLVLPGQWGVPEQTQD